jgi:hypothetical protein
MVQDVFAVLAAPSLAQRLCHPFPYTPPGMLCAEFHDPVNLCSVNGGKAFAVNKVFAIPPLLALPVMPKLRNLVI